MRSSERALFIDIMAAAVPDAIDLNDDMQTADCLRMLAPIAGYLQSDVSRDFEPIRDRAIQLREERNGPAF